MSERKQEETPTKHGYSICWLNLTVFISSMCIMILELSAGRLISRYLGQSLYTWTSVIGVVLAGISIGNYIGGRLADAFNPRRTLVVLFLLSSLSCFVIPVLNHMVGLWKELLFLSWPMRIFLHVLVTFLLPSAILGTISPAVAKMALERQKPIGRTIGSVYAWGTAGSIFGTFITGFYLVAALGTIAVIVTVGIVLGVMGLIYGVGIKWRLPTALAYIAIGLFTFASQPVLAHVGSALYFRNEKAGNVVFEAESQYQYISVRSTSSDPNIRGLYLDKMLHSEMNVQQPTNLLYRYAWIYETLLNDLRPDTKPLNTFVIGGGGLTFPSYLALSRPGGWCDVAEIDQEVSDAARQFCGFKDHPEIHLHHMDARNFVTDQINRLEQGQLAYRYDFVFGDTFNDYSVPFHLVTKEFNDQISALMTDDGVYMLNMIDVFSSGRFLGSVVKTFKETFPNVYVVFAHRNLSVRGTYVVICSKKALNLTELTERITARHPDFHGQMLDDAHVSELTTRPVVTLLTDNYAPVENLLASVVKEDQQDGIDLLYLKEGLIAANQGDFQKAIEQFEKGLAINSGNPQLHYNMGVAFMSQNKPEKALDAFAVAVQLNPTYTQARVNAGVLLANMGQLEASAGQFSNILSYEPSNVDARINYSTILAAFGKNEEARDTLLQALDYAPTNASILNNLGEIMLRMGNRQQSIEYFQQALTINPGLTQAQMRLTELRKQ